MGFAAAWALAMGAGGCLSDDGHAGGEGGEGGEGGGGPAEGGGDRVEAAPDGDEPGPSAPDGEGEVEGEVEGEGQGGGPGDGAVAPARCPAPASADPTRVGTSSGALIGEEQGGAWVYKGIPYAAPPVGALRWAPPDPPGCWGGLLRATAFGPSCPQLDEAGAPVGDEDCLTLNVWRPRPPAAGDGAPGPAAPAPVMVFLHGGGNVAGGAATEVAGETLYDGAWLAETRGVVVVTLNYRLGALGWLVMDDTAGDRDAAGNYGLLDQLAALRWVRGEIAQFGGDPARVLLFGESAGAVGACAVAASPESEGLLAGVILQSGACTVRTQAEVRAESARVADGAGCGVAPSPLGCLRTVTAAELLAAFPPVVSVAGRSSDLQPHAAGPALPDQPAALLAAGAAAGLSFVVGSNTEETGLAAPAVPDVETYEALVRALLPVPAVSARVLAAYPPDDWPSPRAAWVALTTDAKFTCTARRAARAAREGAGGDPAAPGALRVRRYLFGQNLARAPVRSEAGAFHGIELPFVFGRMELAGYRPTPGERALSELVATYWTSAAATGDPNGEGRPAWAAYDDPVRDPALFLHGDGARMVEGFRSAQCDLWDDLAGASG